MKTAIVNLIFLFLSAVIIAQPIYQASDYGGIGDSLDFSGAATDSVYINPILDITGEQVTWDFSDLTVVDQFSTTVESKEESGYQSGFLLTCTLVSGDPFECNRFWSQEVDYAIPVDGAAFGGQFSDIKIFRKLQDNLLTEAIIGLSIDNQGMAAQLGFPYTQIDTVLEFPLEYGKSFSAPSAFDMDFSVFQFPFAYFHKQERNSTVDAYGTLITPYKTYNDVLRLTTEIVYDDVIDFNGQMIPLPRVEYVYEWYEQSEKAPILEVRADVPRFGGPFSIASVRYLDSLRCFDPIPLFNPDALMVELVDGEATIQFANRSRFAEDFTWDFGDGNGSTDEFPSHTYTAEGMYTVTLTACNEICDPPICNDFSVQVQVTEPTSSDENSLSDIDFVYDASSESLSLTSWERIEELKIYTNLGVEIMARNSAELSNSIDVSLLNQGVYYLSIKDKEGRMVSKSWLKH